MSDGKVSENPTPEEAGGASAQSKEVRKGDSVTVSGRANVPRVEDWMEDDAEAETGEGQ